MPANEISKDADLKVNIIHLVVIFSIGTILLILFLTYIHKSQLNKLNLVISEGHIESKKMLMNSALIRDARARIRNLYEIIESEDPFKKDELNIEIQNSGGRFAGVRQELLKMDLRPEEKVLLDQIEDLGNVIPYQINQVLDLVTMDTAESKEDAKKLLYQEILPNQDKLVNILEKLTKIEHSQLVEQGNSAQYAITTASKELNWLIAFAVSTITILTLLLIWRIRNIQREKYQTYSALRLSEESLRDTEMERDRLASVIEAATDFVGISDPQGNIIYLNQTGRTLSGVGDMQVENMRIENFHPTDTIERIFNEGMPSAIANGDWTGETEMLGATGERIPMSQVIMSHRNDQGEVTYMSTIMRDITERKQIAEELERRVRSRTRELHELNQELEAFSYSVSHDLRAPLRAINGFSQALEEDCEASLDPPGKDYLKRIRNASIHMGELIDGMLHLSRVTRSDLQLAVLDLTGISNNIIERYRLSEPEREIEIDVEKDLACKADRKLMEIVMENLLGNAWKYTGKTEKPCISVGQVEKEGEEWFYVRDNGVGFDMSYADKLFGVFQRMHSDSEFKGTGIGLATVQRILHRHGGKIFCEAKPNEGATFYFLVE